MERAGVRQTTSPRSPRRPNLATGRQMPIAPSRRRLLHCSHTSFTRISPSFPRRREPRIPGPLYDPLALWERVRVRGSGDRKSNQMQLNATELKVSSLLATRDETTAIGSKATPAHRVRVSGVSKRGHSGLISNDRPEVNEAKQGQIDPRSTPSSLLRTPVWVGPSFRVCGGQAVGHTIHAFGNVWRQL